MFQKLLIYFKYFNNFSLINCSKQILVSLSLLSILLGLHPLLLFSGSFFRLGSHLLYVLREFFRLYPVLNYTFAWIKDYPIIKIPVKQGWPVSVPVVKLPVPEVAIHLDLLRQFCLYVYQYPLVLLKVVIWLLYQ